MFCVSQSAFVWHRVEATQLLAGWFGAVACVERLLWHPHICSVRVPAHTQTSHPGIGLPHRLSLPEPGRGAKHRLLSWQRLSALTCTHAEGSKGRYWVASWRGLLQSHLQGRVGQSFSLSAVQNQQLSNERKQIRHLKLRVKKNKIARHGRRLNLM